MYQESLNKKFKIAYKDRNLVSTDKVLFFSESGEYLSYLKDENEISVLDIVKYQLSEFDEAKVIYAFEIDDEHYYIYSIENIIDKEKFKIVNRMSVLKEYSEKDAYIILSASHIFSWNQNTKYCGRCGHLLDNKLGERAKICSDCNTVYYPQIAPAVIVAIENNGKLLMTKYAKRKTSRYALVAGFIEIGETTEDAIKREVEEEVGLKVTDIQYFASQPWGISGGLLLGYYAKLNGPDDITLDLNELKEATWMDIDQLRKIEVNTKTLTGTMIDRWIKNYN
jgi:NAD+ diphosphatase